MPTARTPDIRMNRYMYKGYETPDAPAGDDAHPPEQWREQRTPADRHEAMPIQSVCGWQARRFLSDIEEQKII
jgi:hypothetical protein